MKKKGFLVALLSLFLFVAPVQADTYLDFNMDGIHPVTASISFAGGAAPLIGVDISVDSVVGIGTPLSPGVTVPLPGAVLNFTTGDFNGTAANSWFFGSGGSISVMWGAQQLIMGGFNSAQVVGIPGQTFKVTIATFWDEKYIPMLEFYGLPTDILYTGNMNLSFNAVGVAPGSFTSTSVLSGDIENRGKIPEPISLILLGSGLAGAGLYRRLRKPKG